MTIGAEAENFPVQTFDKTRMRLLHVSYIMHFFRKSLIHLMTQACLHNGYEEEFDFSIKDL